MESATSGMASIRVILSLSTLLISLGSACCFFFPERALPKSPSWAEDVGTETPQKSRAPMAMTRSLFIRLSFMNMGVRGTPLTVDGLGGRPGTTEYRPEFHTASTAGQERESPPQKRGFARPRKPPGTGGKLRW